MKVHAIDLANRPLNQVGKCHCGAKIAIMGIAYKKNIDNPKESPAIKIIKGFVNLGTNVQVYDPLVPSLTTKVGDIASVGKWKGHSRRRIVRSSSRIMTCSTKSRGDN